MKSLLIVNKNAGQHHFEEVDQAVKEAFGESLPEITVTKAPGHARKLASDAVASGCYNALYVAGGDGTVNEVVTGMLTSDSALLRPPLGIIPTGTCNVLATELGIPCSDFGAAVHVARHGRPKKIDIGKMGHQYFLLMAGFGFDAAAVRDVALPLKDIVGPSAYVMAGLAALAKYQPSRVTLRIDDDTVSMDAFMVVVANISSYAFKEVKIAPFASLDDGWLDICIFEKPPMHTIGFVGQVMLLLARRHLGDPRVRYYRGRHIEIISNPPVAAQIDGDVEGETPVVIDVIPQALSVMVPKYRTA